MPGIVWYPNEYRCEKNYSANYALLQAFATSPPCLGKTRAHVPRTAGESRQVNGMLRDAP